MIIGIDPSLTSTGLSNGLVSLLVKTSPDNNLKPMEDLIRRVESQMSAIRRFTTNDDTVYIEDVMKTMAIRGVADADGNVRGSIGAGHLFEMGVWFAHYYILFPTPILVSPSQLKSYVGGKGNFPKAKMMTAVYKRWAIEFEGDPGLDQLHAYCLHKMGTDISNGVYQHAEPKRRGQGIQAVAKRLSRNNVKKTL